MKPSRVVAFVCIALTANMFLTMAFIKAVFKSAQPQPVYHPVKVWTPYQNWILREPDGKTYIIDIGFRMDGSLLWRHGQEVTVNTNTP